MDVLKLHRDIIDDYKKFVRSFIHISDEAIRDKIEQNINSGDYWPDPLFVFNPSFKKGDTINELCDRGILHPNTGDIFSGYDLYRHQVEAVKMAHEDADYVVTSGTGSGKSLTFMAPVFDHLVKEKPSRGVNAVIVYPMNALINSQEEEIKGYEKKYKDKTGKEFPISFKVYTGQEKAEVRENVRNSPPNILLTNYMMLELILTRPGEEMLRRAIFDHIKFLVFDELHTYRGRQGADVALLVSRIRAMAKHPISTIGTSATMVSGDASIEDQKTEVANVAAKLLGGTFTTSQIIGEYLDRCFPYDGQIPDRDALRRAVDTTIDLNDSEELLKSSPLSIWLENKIALEQKEGVLVRGKPRKLIEIAGELANDTGLDIDRCTRQLMDYLNWLARVNESKKSARSAYLPFKIHQFISQTGGVYVSLHRDEKRIISVEPQALKNVDGEMVHLYPVVFSRVSGKELIVVTLDSDSQRLIPREFKDVSEEEENLLDGYIIADIDAWNPDTDMELLPDAWIKTDRTGNVKPKTETHARRLPRRIYYDSKGNYSMEDKTELPYQGWFMTTPLFFDPTSGETYVARTGENTKLTRLGSEGRSTSTTVLSFSVLKNLADQGVVKESQKLLSFTDNRQDAALQSGHFNDFINVVRLRSAIYHALKENNVLEFKNLDDAIFNALDLPQEHYSNRPSGFLSGKRDNEQAFKDFLMYQCLHDLRRSWRVVLPNLEQCGLLEIHFQNLEENCTMDEWWQDVPLLNQAAPEERKEIVYQVLDYFRKAYALHSEQYLTDSQIKGQTRIIEERLREPWKFGKNNGVKIPSYMRYETLGMKGKQRLFTTSIGSNSGLGKYLRQEARNRGLQLKGDSYIEFVGILMKKLTDAGWLHEVLVENAAGETTGLYRLYADQIIWKLGDGNHIIEDKVKRRSYKDQYKPRPNPFFRELYKTRFTDMKVLEGREHTGQLESSDRKEYEKNFRTGKDSVLFCSPTMELGIDINELNVVHMRNVPPLTFNYAQRGGRAGRRGQAALVVTNCSVFSPHDRHYFHHQQDMVAGVVAAPKLELDNMDLVESHLNAIYLAKAGLHDMTKSIKDILVMDDHENLPLKPEVVEKLKLSDEAEKEVASVFKKVAADLTQRLPQPIPWLNDDWITATLGNAGNKFDTALDRWRHSYKMAQRMMNEAWEIIRSGLYPAGSKEMTDAERRQKQASRQRTLLANESFGENISEFYPYRYLASEGFLPGYNFPRLPYRSYIAVGESGEYVSRPRLIALREYGPNSIIYRKGKKYKVEQLMLTDIENQLKKAKVSVNSGYILMDDEYNSNNCPFSGVSLTDGSSYRVFADLVPMAETRCVETARISCEEEERILRGYEIDTYFHVKSGMHTTQKARVMFEDKNYLNLTFLPAASLVQINKKWRVTRDDGFLMGMRSGFWKKDKHGTPRETGKKKDAEESRRVMIYTDISADALYIEPIAALNLESDGVLTLMYALKKAIEYRFLLEEREMAVTQMGDPKHPNIFLYENAEGSLGVLSQFTGNSEIFLEAIREAYRLCRFDEEDYKDPASYDDLLSYTNQRHHERIDRFKIKSALEILTKCKVEPEISRRNITYDERHRQMLAVIDPNSEMEKRFLDYLYREGLKLPDQAQQVVEDIYCRPDFYYHPGIHVFCDGTPHDKPEIKEYDTQRRKAIRKRGEQVLVWNYKEKLADFIARRPDVFKKVR